MYITYPNAIVMWVFMTYPSPMYSILPYKWFPYKGRILLIDILGR
jgi:hypothetical protein